MTEGLAPFTPSNELRAYGWRMLSRVGGLEGEGVWYGLTEKGVVVVVDCYEVMQEKAIKKPDKVSWEKLWGEMYMF